MFPLSFLSVNRLYEKPITPLIQLKTHKHKHTLKEPQKAISNDVKPDGAETVDDIWPPEDDNIPVTAESKVEPDKHKEKAQKGKAEVLGLCS